jgi:hypothetical protein
MALFTVALAANENVSNPRLVFYERLLGSCPPVVLGEHRRIHRRTSVSDDVLRQCSFIKLRRRVQCRCDSCKQQLVLLEHVADTNTWQTVSALSGITAQTW